MDTNIRTAIARLHCPRCGRAKNACCGLAMHDEITRLRAELAEARRFRKVIMDYDSNLYDALADSDAARKGEGE